MNIKPKTYWWALAGCFVGLSIFAAWSGRKHGQLEVAIEEDKQCLENATVAMRWAAEEIGSMRAKLHYDSGGGTVILAASFHLDDTIVVHQHVLDIIKIEDPEHAHLWTVEIVYDPESYTREWWTRPYAVIVPEISMPAFGSLCETLNQRWGWREFYRPPIKGNRPAHVDRSIKYPGQADLMCAFAHYMAIDIPHFHWEDRRWIEWEIEMMNDPGGFEEYERAMKIDWGDSPWRKRPQPRQYVFYD